MRSGGCPARLLLFEATAEFLLCDLGNGPADNIVHDQAHSVIEHLRVSLPRGLFLFLIKNFRIGNKIVVYRGFLFLIFGNQ